MLEDVSVKPLLFKSSVFGVLRNEVRHARREDMMMLGPYEGKKGAR